MVLQVGDKVVVWGAGTSSAFAKKIDPIQVGDKVDVITLHDGSKIPLPRLELDLSDYVWCIPEWDTGMDIGNGDFSWGVMPLGAATFTLTDIIDCWHVKDSLREWESSISGCLMIMVSGANKGIRYIISSFFEYIYSLTLNETVPSTYYGDWEEELYGPRVTVSRGDTAEISCHSEIVEWNQGKVFTANTDPIVGASGFTLPYKIVMNYRRCTVYTYLAHPDNERTYLDPELVAANTLYTAEECTALGIDPSALINKKYPDYDTITIDLPLYLDGCVGIMCWTTDVQGYINASFGAITFIGSDCITEGLVAGDKYVVYNPTTKRLVFNDSTKTVLSSEYWRAVETPGEEIAISAVEYAWDGQGYVYLSASKTVFSTIYFDDEIRVDGTAAGTTKTIAYHAGDRISYGGETVSRELVDITAALRAGNNSVVVTVKDTGGSKVGFPTAVYIKRSMTPITL